MEDKQIIPDYDVIIPDNPLKEMFERQKKFQKRFYDLETMSRDERTKYMMMQLMCINVEQVEALNWLTEPSWKPWKKESTPFNRKEFINELVDVQHFLINALIAVDCDHEEFLKAFFNKNHENVVRQERGY